MEHANLTVDQFSLAKEGEKKVLIYREKSSKNHTGTLKDIGSEVKEVKALENLNCQERSPTFIFEKYLQHRPPGVERLYLRPLKRKKRNLWYSQQPVGLRKIEQMLVSAMKEAGIEGNFTPHSLRATATTPMFRAGLDNKIIMKVTGHRSEKGLNAYKRVSKEQEYAASTIIQGDSSHSTSPVFMDNASKKSK